MLNRGQKRAKENAALAAESCCAAECTLERFTEASNPLRD
jgi:hypothetical protein